MGGGIRKTVVPLQKFNLHAPDSVSIISTDTTTTTTTDTDAATIPASTMAAIATTVTMSATVTAIVELKQETVLSHG